LAEEFAFGTGEERQAMGGKFAAAATVAKTGDLSSIPEDMRKSVLSVFKQFGDIDFAGAGTGKEIVNAITALELGRARGRPLTPDEMRKLFRESNKEQTLMDDLRGLEKERQAAQLEAIKSQQVGSDNFAQALETENTRFLAELKQILSPDDAPAAGLGDREFINNVLNSQRGGVVPEKTGTLGGNRRRRRADSDGGEEGSLFARQGTDTVPAMLTAGEFIINKKAAGKNMEVLNAINSGAVITPQYAQGGAVVGGAPSVQDNVKFDPALRLVPKPVLAEENSRNVATLQSESVIAGIMARGDPAGQLFRDDGGTGGNLGGSYFVKNYIDKSFGGVGDNVDGLSHVDNWTTELRSFIDSYQNGRNGSGSRTYVNEGQIDSLALAGGKLKDYHFFLKDELGAFLKEGILKTKTSVLPEITNKELTSSQNAKSALETGVTSGTIGLGAYNINRLAQIPSTSLHEKYKSGDLANAISHSIEEPGDKETTKTNIGNITKHFINQTESMQLKLNAAGGGGEKTELEMWLEQVKVQRGEGKSVAAENLMSNKSSAQKDIFDGILELKPSLLNDRFSTTRGVGPDGNIEAKGYADSYNALKEYYESVDSDGLDVISEAGIKWVGLKAKTEGFWTHTGDTQVNDPNYSSTIPTIERRYNAGMHWMTDFVKNDALTGIAELMEGVHPIYQYGGAFKAAKDSDFNIDTAGIAANAPSGLSDLKTDAIALKEYAGKIETMAGLQHLYEELDVRTFDWKEDMTGVDFGINAFEQAKIDSEEKRTKTKKQRKKDLKRGRKQKVKQREKDEAVNFGLTDPEYWTKVANHILDNPSLANMPVGPGGEKASEMVGRGAAKLFPNINTLYNATNTLFKRGWIAEANEKRFAFDEDMMKEDYLLAKSDDRKSVLQTMDRMHSASGSILRGTGMDGAPGGVGTNFYRGVFGDKAAEQAANVEKATLDAFQTLSEVELPSGEKNKAGNFLQRAEVRFKEIDARRKDASLSEPWEWSGFTEDQYRKMPRRQRVQVYGQWKRDSDAEKEKDRGEERRGDIRNRRFGDMGKPIELNAGGVVPGQGVGDTVPAMLTPGEFVINKGAVGQHGVGFLRALNEGGLVQYLQDGEKVQEQEATPTGLWKQSEGWSNWQQHLGDFLAAPFDAMRSVSTQREEARRAWENANPPSEPPVHGEAMGAAQLNNPELWDELNLSSLIQKGYSSWPTDNWWKDAQKLAMGIQHKHGRWKEFDAASQADPRGWDAPFYTAGVESNTSDLPQSVYEGLNMTASTTWGDDKPSGMPGLSEGAIGDHMTYWLGGLKDKGRTTFTLTDELKARIKYMELYGVKDSSIDPTEDKYTIPAQADFTQVETAIGTPSEIFFDGVASVLNQVGAGQYVAPPHAKKVSRSLPWMKRLNGPDGLPDNPAQLRSYTPEEVENDTVVKNLRERLLNIKKELFTQDSGGNYTVPILGAREDIAAAGTYWRDFQPVLGESKQEIQQTGESLTMQEVFDSLKEEYIAQAGFFETKADGLFTKSLLPAQGQGSDWTNEMEAASDLFLDSDISTLGHAGKQATAAAKVLKLKERERKATKREGNAEFFAQQPLANLLTKQVMSQTGEPTDEEESRMVGSIDLANKIFEKNLPSTLTGTLAARAGMGQKLKGSLWGSKIGNMLELPVISGTEGRTKAYEPLEWDDNSALLARVLEGFRFGGANAVRYGGGSDGWGLDNINDTRTGAFMRGENNELLMQAALSVDGSDADYLKALQGGTVLSQQQIYEKLARAADANRPAGQAGRFDLGLEGRRGGAMEAHEAEMKKRGDDRAKKDIETAKKKTALAEEKIRALVMKKSAAYFEGKGDPMTRWVPNVDEFGNEIGADEWGSIASLSELGNGLLQTKLTLGGSDAEHMPGITFTSQETGFAPDYIPVTMGMEEIRAVSDGRLAEYEAALEGAYWNRQITAAELMPIGGGEGILKQSMDTVASWVGKPQLLPEGFDFDEFEEDMALGALAVPQHWPFDPHGNGPVAQKREWNELKQAARGMDVVGLTKEGAKWEVDREIERRQEAAGGGAISKWGGYRGPGELQLYAGTLEKGGAGAWLRNYHDERLYPEGWGGEEGVLSRIWKSLGTLDSPQKWNDAAPLPASMNTQEAWEKEFLANWQGPELTAQQTALAHKRGEFGPGLVPAHAARPDAAGFAAGGSIFKPQGTDTVPAMLTPGEFVMRKSVVDKHGTGFFSALNDGRAQGFQGGGAVQYLQNGGLGQEGQGRVTFTTLIPAFKMMFDDSLMMLSDGLHNFMKTWKESLKAPEAVAGGGGGGGGGGAPEAVQAFNNAVTALNTGPLSQFSAAVDKLAGATITLELPTGINVNLIGLDLMAGLMGGLKDFVLDNIISTLKTYKAGPNGLTEI